MPTSFARRRRRCVRIVSWNVNKRRDCATQASAISTMRPDVVVLQEVNARTWANHREQFADAGLVHAVSAIELPSRRRAPARVLSSFVAIASRWPIAAARPASVPAREAIACVSVASPVGAFDVIGVHIPTYGRPLDRELKLETQEGLIRRLKRITEPTLLCGDFNSPLAEHLDGTVVPFARPRNARRHDAEVMLMGLRTAHGLTDVFRAHHGYGVEASSWYWKNRGRTGGYRLDHIFATHHFTPRACDYVQEWRLRGLSDHAAIVADFVMSDSGRVDRSTAST